MLFPPPALVVWKPPTRWRPRLPQSCYVSRSHLGFLLPVRGGSDDARGWGLRKLLQLQWRQQTMEE